MMCGMRFWSLRAASSTARMADSILFCRGAREALQASTWRPSGFVNAENWNADRHPGSGLRRPQRLPADQHPLKIVSGVLDFCWMPPCSMERNVRRAINLSDPS
jgi:hypothetical protein